MEQALIVGIPAAITLAGALIGHGIKARADAVLAEARRRNALYPATMKACEALGLKWRAEWEQDGAWYVLAYEDLADREVVLRLDPATWKVVEEAALWQMP